MLTDSVPRRHGVPTATSGVIRETDYPATKEPNHRPNVAEHANPQLETAPHGTSHNNEGALQWPKVTECQSAAHGGWHLKR